MYAQVIVDVAHSNVAKPFTYSLNAEQHIEIGTRVRVPLGARLVDGFVIGLSENPPQDLPAEKLRPIIKPLDSYPALLPPLLALAEEMALQSHCPLCETLRLMLPAAMRQSRIQEKKVQYAALCQGVDLQNAVDANKRSQKKVLLLQLLSDGQPKSVPDLGGLVRQPQEALHSLCEQHLIVLEERTVFRAPTGVEKIERTTPPPLTPEQQEAVDEMLPSLEQGKGAFLLHGVTGSGKTEVFLTMVRNVLQSGKSAIILVPEIALTPQMVRWFCSRFGNETAVLHSRLTDGQRYDEWRRIRLGQARVVVGARSAIFAPVQNLGLIVVDEEHEQTYLSDKHPRYDARETAMSRCRREGAMLLLSSATPSILSFAKARRGDYTLIEMPYRVNHRPMPKVMIVDMRRELETGNRSIFSRELMSKLQQCMKNGQQAMLFLNRRGYHTFVSCRKCGYVVKCEQCDLSMTLHQEENERGPQLLRCHMCGATQPPPNVCPQCGSPYIRYFGTGTQRVEEEVHRLFPGIQTVRMDIDTTREREAHTRLLEKFGTGEAKILIGTQMIAKGLDFPKVTLVGIIAADISLNLPDYRSPERTFQLITQVAGRAGRATDPGEVIVQTYKPDHPCIEAAARQDYRSFFEMEFSRRRTGLYPPFTMLCRLLIESADEEIAKALSRQLYQTMEDYLVGHPAQKKRALLIRADEAPVKKIRGLYRYHVLFKLFVHPDSDATVARLSELASESYENAQVYCEINPVTMM